MRKLVTGMVVLSFVLWTAARATAQTNAELKAEVDALKQQVALLQQGKTADVKVEETRKIAKEISTDSTQYSSDFKIVWQDGVWFKSTDDKFALHVGGRFMVDWGWVGGATVERDLKSKTSLGAFQAAEFQDGVELRSLRLLAEGTLYKYVNFKVEMDFHGFDENITTFSSPTQILASHENTSTVVPKDVYLEATKLPIVGNIRVGHFKEPFGLENTTDDLFLTFMERSAGNCLAPGYNYGIMAHDAILGEPGAKRMTWAIGMFRSEGLGNAGPVGFINLRPTDETSDGTPVFSDQGYALTARVTALPYYADKGEKLVHVGLSYSHRGTNDGRTARFMARPESDFFKYSMLDVTVLNADNLDLFGAEAAVVYGPFSAQMEYTGAVLSVDSPSNLPTVISPYGTTGVASRNLCYNAFYFQTSYFLTGEHRAYNTETGTFDRVRPKKNFREDGGWGAVEVAARYSYLDLDEDGLATFNQTTSVEQTTVLTGAASRGEYNIGTFGVNWYLNPNVKVAANYIRACPVMTVTSSSFDIFMMRFQVDF